TLKRELSTLVDRFRRDVTAAAAALRED
ncbi:MAG: hypothetical protein JWP86_1321, partial [Phenylobacterium sp.]|nr:hypothetical protein [Phenylobacterium sp.]